MGKAWAIMGNSNCLRSEVHKGWREMTKDADHLNKSSMDIYVETFVNSQLRVNRLSHFNSSKVTSIFLESVDARYR
jgi:hypothetical protein